MKTISILGSTGSVGCNTLNVIRALKEEFKVLALAAHSNIELLYEQIQEFKPLFAAVYDEEQAERLQKKTQIKIFKGLQGLIEAAVHPEVDKVMLAMSSNQGIEPTYHAINAGKEICLANKEVLVSAGSMIMELARKKNVKVIPVDSEHSALFQCLGQNSQKIRRLILTASGGPFYKHSEEKLRSVTLKEALCHPKWNMGKKITIDSSTLMNKGLEVIEAHHLFDMDPQKIDVVVHPQSIIHSMVEFVDGSILAQMSEPNMMYPIQYALTYPKRCKTSLAPFDFTKHNRLSFEEYDPACFPCLSLAFEALKKGGSSCCFLNACNESLVHRFLNQEITWNEISQKLEKLMSSHIPENMLNLPQVFSIDKKARELANKI